jgi:TPP-dependent pyruvate/acetoin dehydrogenase alpha subunit
MSAAPDRPRADAAVPRPALSLPAHWRPQRDVHLTAADLVAFEAEVKARYENQEIRAPIHLSSNNEVQLIEIFRFVGPHDWVFSTWRNHYHALLHGVPRAEVMRQIVEGRSMCMNSVRPRFYASSLVAGALPIAVGTALAAKRTGASRKTWAFVGDMCFESGVFYEAYKYARNHGLPMEFVVEDNNLSTNTPTPETWGGVKRPIPDDIAYYTYTSDFPHHGTGTWVLF